MKAYIEKQLYAKSKDKGRHKSNNAVNESKSKSKDKHKSNNIANKNKCKGKAKEKKGTEERENGRMKMKGSRNGSRNGRIKESAEEEKTIRKRGYSGNEKNAGNGKYGKSNETEDPNKNQSEEDNFYVIFEPTGIYSNYLKEFCIDNRIKAYIVNPKKTSNFAKVISHRSKTDKIDAKMLYAFNVLINKDELKVPSDDNISNTLSSYLSMYWFVIKMRISVSNYVEMLEYTDIEQSDRMLFSLFEKEVKRYKDIQEKIISKAEKLIKSNGNLKKKYEYLLSIPGIGRASAVALISLFLKYPDTNRAEITALTGLDPTRKESGISVRGKRRISKSGDKMIRKMLYMPTMNAIQHNEVIKSFYERLVNEKHKPKKAALIASMKKLLLIAHSVYKNETPFCNNFSEKHSVKADKTNPESREEIEQTIREEKAKEGTLKQVRKGTVKTNGKVKSKQTTNNHLIKHTDKKRTEEQRNKGQTKKRKQTEDATKKNEKRIGKTA